MNEKNLQENKESWSNRKEISKKNNIFNNKGNFTAEKLQIDKILLDPNKLSDNNFSKLQSNFKSTKAPLKNQRELIFQTNKDLICNKNAEININHNNANVNFLSDLNKESTFINNNINCERKIFDGANKIKIPIPSNFNSINNVSKSDILSITDNNHMTNEEFDFKEKQPSNF